MCESVHKRVGIPGVSVCTRWTVTHGRWNVSVPRVAVVSAIDDGK